MNINFKYIKAPDNSIRDDAILYFDADGSETFVPRNHRIWIEIFEPWLAAGNTPLGPDDPWPLD